MGDPIPPDPSLLHLLLDEPWTAARNMARDEALLDGGRAVLRRASWGEPAVTIGRFQEWRLIDHAGHARAPVRRITGGGAILHGDDLTIALVADCPSPLLPERAPRAIAARLARALERALAPWHAGAHPRGGESAERAQRGILDCFARETPFDLVVDRPDGAREKVAGFALHRRGGRVLVQGSVRRSAGLVPAVDGEVLAALADQLGATTRAIPDLDEREEERSWRLLERRYGAARWNRRIRGDAATASDAAVADPDGAEAAGEGEEAVPDPTPGERERLP